MNVVMHASFIALVHGRCLLVAPHNVNDSCSWCLDQLLNSLYAAARSSGNAALVCVCTNLRFVY